MLSPTNESVENVCTLYGYDAVGNRITTTNALNQTSLTVYDESNRPIVNVANVRLSAHVEAWDGTLIIDEADCSFPPAQADSNLCTVTYYDAHGRRSATRDPLGNLTEFDYDSRGRLITTTRYLDDVPVVTVNHYDALGNRVGQTDAMGYTTTYIYDDLNRLAATVSAEGVVTVRGYDELGRVVTTTDSLGHQTLSDYDILGRRVAVTDAENNVTRYAYDALGSQAAITDANGVRTSYLYDDLNRLVAVIENDTGGAPTHDSNVLTQYVYDVLGNRVVITNALGYTSTHTTYDALGRSVVVEDALGHKTYTRYNALGYRTVVTDANGAVTRYSFDGLNRLTLVHYVSDGVTVAYRYDAASNRTVMTDTLGVTRYVYDDLYRLVSATDPFTGTVSYGYDLVGNRTQLIYPDGQVATHTYDADNRLVQVEDWSGGLTGYEYDVAGRLITTTLPNGVATTYRYDAANRSIDLTHTAADGTLLSSYRYELDGTGNRVRAVETLTETTRAITYTYDSLYRLTKADYSTGENFQYTYNAMGNMMAMTTTMTNTVVTTKAYDAANRLITVTANGAARTLEWSDSGELLRDGDDTYEWDTAGRLVRATVDGVTSRFAYLGDGDRISMTVGSETTTYTLDLAAPLVQVLVAHKSANRQISEYLYGVTRIGEYDDAWHYHLMDYLGSVRSLVGADGSVEGARAYQPYGSPLSNVGSVSSVYGFTGEQTDPTGLVYLRARMYAPWLGQFMSRDGWPGNVRRPGTLYAWSYVQSNPINLVDPTGFISFDWRDLIFSPAGAVVNLFKNMYSKAGMTRVCLFHNTSQHPSDTIDDLLTDYICEFGPEHRFFNADAHLTQQLARSATIHFVREKFYREGKAQGDYPVGPSELWLSTVDSVWERDWTHYPIGVIPLPLNITEFLGSFDYKIWRDSLWVYFEVHNKTSLESGTRIPPQLGGTQGGNAKSVEEVLETHPYWWRFRSIVYIMGHFDIKSILKSKTRDETGGFLGREGGGDMQQTFRWREQYFECGLPAWPAIRSVLRIERYDLLPR
jgi:RHS repeat-associated protein